MSKECGDFKGCGTLEQLAERETLITAHMTSIMAGALSRSLDPEDFNEEGPRQGIVVVNAVVAEQSEVMRQSTSEKAAAILAGDRSLGEVRKRPGAPVSAAVVRARRRSAKSAGPTRRLARSAS